MNNELSARMHMYLKMRENETHEEAENRLEEILADLETQGVSFQIYETEIQ